MKKSTFLLCIFLLATTNFLFAQVGIGTITPNNSSMLDIESTDKGILIPRMTETQKMSVSSPVSGLLIYQIDKEAGFYFYDGSVWLRLVKNISPNFTGTITSESISSTGTISATSFVGDGSGLTGINFNTVSITTNINDIAANAASINTNQGQIASNTASITTNQGAIATNTASITTNINDIATNTANINTNQGLIASNTASITTNQGAIAANTATITTNINDIATNTANINTNQGLIASNTASITTNQGAIAANTASITTNINDIALKANKADPTFTGTITSGSISATGTISATDFVGDGSGLTGIITTIGDSTITSSKILDGTILDADISSDAGIDQSKISGLTGALSNKVDIVAGQRLISAEEITLLGNQSGTNTGDQDISGIASNTLAIGTLSSLTTTNKADLVSAINELDGGLDLKLDSNKVGVANGVASLDALGKIPTAQIPQVSFSSVSVLTNQSEMLSLSGAVVGSVVIRTDISKNFVLSSTDASVLGNWIELVNPDAPVQTVNGKSGNVLLTKADIDLANLDNTSDLSKPISTLTQSALDSKSNKANPTFTGTINSGAIISTGQISASLFVGDGSGLTSLPPITDESITSDKILNGTILDADISSEAAINQSKISGLTGALSNKVDIVAGERLITAGEITLLGNQSGTNTGDQDISGIASNTLAIGTISDLTTTNKADLVSAINWINSGYNEIFGFFENPTFTTITSGSISATGTISATEFVGDGSKLTNLPSNGGGLQSITENGITGYRRADANAANYGDIGLKAVDLSYSSATSGSYGATGDYSNAMGYNTNASGGVSTAMGDGTIASGDVSTAMGVGTEANGTLSTAMGLLTTASDFGSLVIGSFNNAGSSISSGGNATSFTLSNTAFVIGNGADDESRSDAFKVMFNGDTTAAGTISATYFVGDGSRLTDLPSVTDESITSDKILNGTILNADISSAAAIDQSKISGLTDALINKVDKVVGERLITAGEITLLGNQSGTNTGDQDISGIASNTLAIGTISDLTTTNKADLVSAINWINSGYNEIFGFFENPTFTTITSGSISATGTISATEFVGDGSKLTNLPSNGGGLQSITENGITGYRRSDANAANYGDIGEGAVDLSYSSATSGSYGATGDYSNAMGIYTTASEAGSTAIGFGTTASGQGSAAMGYGTTASGEASTAMGFTTTASDYGSLIIGSFNNAGSSISSGGDATSFTLSNTAFVIGNGADDESRSDAFKVMFNGDTTAAGTISATYFVGDGSRLTNLPFSSDLTGEVSLVGNSITLSNTAVIEKTLTGFTSGAGQISATDNILQAIQKADGNLAYATENVASAFIDVQASLNALNVNKASLASPIFTGTITSDSITSDSITSGTISSTGEIKAVFFVGDGSRLTDLPSVTDESITSDKILNGTILNADISSAAAIDQSKISGLTDALFNKVDKVAGERLITAGEISQLLNLSQDNSDIAANTASITTNQRLIASNTSSITTNQVAIAANTASITSNISDIALKANTADPTFTGTITSGSISATGTISATEFVGDGSKLIGLPSNGGGLQSITEGETGYRRADADPLNYGNIGKGAVDLSFSGSPSSTMGATGLISTAMGEDTTAEGVNSTAMGSATTAIGDSSTAMGEGTRADEFASTAMGLETTANGYASTAMGEGTIASHYGSLAIGSFNNAGSSILSGEDATSFTLGNTAFVIGNGADDESRNDAFFVDFNGNVKAFGDLESQSIYTEFIDVGEIDAGNVIASGTISATYFVGDGSKLIGLPSGGGLQSITENSNTGYRRSDATAAVYGNIGQWAVDLSISDTSSSTGATGVASIAMGYNTSATSSITTAFGNSTTASGENSTAMGKATTASGNNSTAMGEVTTASGNNSTAMGAVTTASGNNSTAMGEVTIANGQASTAMGSRTVASGIGSTAMGELTTASGIVSTAMGTNTTASDYGSVVIGRYNSAGSSVSTGGSATSFTLSNTAFVIGKGTGTAAGSRSDAFKVMFNGNVTAAGTISATYFVGDGSGLTGLPSTGGLQSITEGSTGYRRADADPLNYGNIGLGAVDLSYSFSSGAFGATGDYSTAMGYYTIANGITSTAMGFTTTASGGYSTAMGEGTIASGDYSTAMGVYTTASGDYSTAMGVYTTASGNISTAMGNNTTASGENSTAMGVGTSALSNGETAIGSHNTTYTPTSNTAWDAADRLFVIGNGPPGGIPSDALVMLKNGNTTFSGTISATEFVGDGSKLTNLPSNGGGLQSITENGITGYRRSDANAANYGDIGEGAVDLSYSDLSVSSGATGDYSTAMGKYTTAEGVNSTAMGSRTVASGIGSTAMGDLTTASGIVSTAMGNQTTASDYGSLIIGSFNNAGSSVSTGGSATAFNTDNTAFVIGNGENYDSRSDAFKVFFNGNTTAAGIVTANGFVGNGSGLTGISSAATATNLAGGSVGQLPYQSAAGTTAFLTNGTAGKVLQSNGTTVAPTWETPTASGGLVSITENSKTGYRRADAIAANYGNIGLGAIDLSYSGSSNASKGATGNSSIAMGEITIASGLNSTAMGYETTALGSKSTAMGYNTFAMGVASTAMGYNTIASGLNSTAMGYVTIASGSNSTAMGVGTSALSNGETAIGSHNTTYTPTSNTAWDAADRLFVIGNGPPGGIPSDALVMLKNGNTTFSGTISASAFFGDGSGLTDLPSSGGLQSITEVETGYRRADAIAANYGDIGLGAVDLSFSGSPSSTMGATGIYSTAMGNSTQASGGASIAMGSNTIASGSYSTAMGDETTANSDASTAMGLGTYANGIASTAMGVRTTASDYNSVVIGQYNSAGSSVSTGGSATEFDTDNTAFVIGKGIGTAAGSRSDAFKVFFNGNTTAAGIVTANGFVGNGSGLTDLPSSGGLQSITENEITGYRRADAIAANYGDIGLGAVDLSFSGSPSSTFGATGKNSTAMGKSTTASGNYSTAMGNESVASGNGSTALGLTKASGDYSTAMGWDNNAIGNNSTAIGNQNTANGEGSLAIGFNTTAYGPYSTAMGSETLADGINSTAMGVGTRAIGSVSTAMGFLTTSSDFGSLVIGSFNSAGSSVSTNGSDTAFDQDNTAFVIGNGTSSTLRSDAFKVMFNGDVTAAGSITAVSFPTSSDRRLKENIKSTKYGLDEVLKLEPVDYNFKSNGLEQIGFIAQDVRSLIPEVVTGKEGDIQKGETLGITYTSLIPVLTKAIQEQQAHISRLEQMLLDSLKKQEAIQKELIEIRSSIKQ